MRTPVNNALLRCSQLIDEAKRNPTEVAYRNLLQQNASGCSDTDMPIECVRRVLQELDFLEPPVDLHAWYVQWFHYIKMQPDAFDDLVFTSKHINWLFCTLGRAVGYSQNVGSTQPSARQKGASKAQGGMSRVIGETWLQHAPRLAARHPEALATLCGLIVPPDAANPAPWSAHYAWSGFSGPDLSAQLLRHVFGTRLAGVVDLVIELHGAHWERCVALRTAVQPTVALDTVLPDGLIPDML